MAGIYIHIPFCKQACHYCDFHFSTSFKHKDQMILALLDEIQLRKNYLTEPINTIYFGGGTPSVLSVDEINTIVEVVNKHFVVENNPEITLEANPDDLTNDKINALAQSPINRLSIGVQSFFDDDLQLMNRSHNAQMAYESIADARVFFDNITLDLIYGIPDMSIEKWDANINKALSLQVPHISSYALTVEPKTALQHLIKKGAISSPDDALAHQHFLHLVKMMQAHDFVHYELSNFGLPGYFSQNNSAYWQGKTYLGIGPSAHSFDGFSRAWNVANNNRYMQQINQGVLPLETEKLSVSDRYNEYVMTGLRTIWGVSVTKIQTEFGQKYVNYLRQNAQKYINNQQLIFDDDFLKATLQGKFFTDGISSDLFWVE